MVEEIECNINLKISIPKGILYYPCCGNDTFEPIRLFLNKVDQFHFADNDGIGLPAVEGHENRRRDTSVFNRVEFCDGREGKLTIRPHWFVEKSSIQHIDVNQETLDLAKTLTDDVNSPKSPGIYQESWGNSRDGSKTEVICHRNDAVITLTSLDKLSVFFYRGDSIGESGSGQWWLGPKLFNFMLDKLLDGGLIITDGSNPEPQKFRNNLEWSLLNVEWSALWDEKIDFVYRDRTFKCLGQLTAIDRRRKTYVWQVKHL